MIRNECVALILAGGRGERLGSLTGTVAKPALSFGGSYRIIDFTLSNCMHSGIHTVGVLTQYNQRNLHSYIGNGHAWGLDRPGKGMFLLPPRNAAKPYSGTANAIYQNMELLTYLKPAHVLVLSGDHIYKMNYMNMLLAHKKSGADVTIAATSVPWKDISRFGIIRADEHRVIHEFEEKPAKSKSNLASMGIYIFKWESLKKYLEQDNENQLSQNDFGKNVLPSMLRTGAKLCAYRFEAYWRDVGTVQSLWESNMDLLYEQPAFELNGGSWKICTSSSGVQTHWAAAERSILPDNMGIYGNIQSSVVSESVRIGRGGEITESVIMENVYIGKNVRIHKAIIGANSVIGDDVVIGAEGGMKEFDNSEVCTGGVSLVAPKSCIGCGLIVKKNSHINKSIYWQDRVLSDANALALV